MAKSGYQKPTSLAEAQANPRYRGKIVVAAGGEVHGTYDGQKAVQLYRKLQRKYPQEKPISTVIPKGPIVMLPTWFRVKDCY